MVVRGRIIYQLMLATKMPLRRTCMELAANLLAAAERKDQTCLHAVVRGSDPQTRAIRVDLPERNSTKWTCLCAITGGKRAR